MIVWTNTATLPSAIEASEEVSVVFRPALFVPITVPLKRKPGNELKPGTLRATTCSVSVGPPMGLAAAAFASAALLNTV
ncbi:MAG TPA: hypothetical protein VMU89_22930 [Thermomicrobiaceae bacterium]|nr:hypothetical protein [Thermomicrobiaceae bacterium]